ncbi:MAG: response regulator [Bacteroidia bacterium]
MINKQTSIFLVDDDAVFLKSLEIEFLLYPEYVITPFLTGEQCINNLNQGPQIIILDYHLDGINKKAINGIQTLDKIHEFNPLLPVIILSSQDKIEVAVDCMHHNACDYIVKNETAFIRLQRKISSILYNQKTEKELKWYMERM